MADSLDASLELKCDAIQEVVGFQNMQKNPFILCRKKKLVSQDFYDPMAVYMEDFIQPFFILQIKVRMKCFFWFKILFC